MSSRASVVSGSVPKSPSNPSSTTTSGTSARIEKKASIAPRSGTRSSRARAKARWAIRAQRQRM